MALREWDNYLTKPGTCSVCRKTFEEHENYYAVLMDVPSGFQRRDFCETCWDDHHRDQAFSFWQAKMPAGEEKRKLFVDDQILMQIFKRLLETNDEDKRPFTFVLALILMRKRLVKYVGTEQNNDQEWWVVRFSGREDELRIKNPNLTEQQLEEIREQLDEVLAEN